MTPQPHKQQTLRQKEDVPPPRWREEERPNNTDNRGNVLPLTPGM